MGTFNLRTGSDVLNVYSFAIFKKETSFYLFEYVFQDTHLHEMLYVVQIR